MRQLMHRTKTMAKLKKQRMVCLPWFSTIVLSFLTLALFAFNTKAAEREGIPYYLSSYPALEDLDVVIHRMRYQREGENIKCAVGLRDSKLFPEIIDGVDEFQRRGTYLTPISIDPPKEAIENIVFFADGQQGSGIDNTQPSALTGHPDEYKDYYIGIGECGETHEFTVKPSSLYSKLRKTNWFPLESTYWFHADDAQYNWGYGSDEGKRTRKSFTKQICSKVGANTQRIYMAGASRGGALVLEIAENIKDTPSSYGCPNMDDVFIYVQTFDAVFKVISDEEFDARKQTVPNPLSDNKKAHILDISDEFTNKNKLKIWSDVGGAHVIAAVRAFTHDSTECREDVYCSLGAPGNPKWYQQIWGNFVHTRYTERPQDEIIHPALDELRRWLNAEFPDFTPVFEMLVQADPRNINQLVNFRAVIPDNPWTASGCPDGFPGGKFSFIGRLHNASDQKGPFKPRGKKLKNILIEIQKLKKHMLLSGDGALIGEGRRFAVQRDGDYSDAMLGPGEIVDVPFSVCLKELEPFRLFVNVIAVQE